MFTLLIGVIAYYNINNHMIWVTAIIGSYVCIVSVTIFTPEMKWPIVMNLPALEEAGAITEVQTSYYMYVGIWIILSALGTLFQCGFLWYYKSRGKQLHFRVQEAVDTFEYGRTADQRKIDKGLKKLYHEVAQMEGSSSAYHDSIYIDLQSQLGSSRGSVLQ